MLFVLLFLVLPFAELALIVAAADAVGLPLTFAALILFSVAGGWLMRREGVTVWRRAQLELEAGRMPASQLLDGAMVLAGGALLLTPGFLTDAVGLFLLVPPVRAVLRPLALRAMARRAARSAGRIRFAGVPVGGDAPFGGGRRDDAVDVDAAQSDPRRPSRAEATVVRTEYHTRPTPSPHEVGPGAGGRYDGETGMPPS